MAAKGKGEVFLIKTTDRKTGVKNLLSHFGMDDFSGKRVALKANFNSADPFPASTHLETLKEIIEELIQAKAENVTLGERSGMGSTRHVLEKMGVLGLSEKLGFKAAILDEASRDEWIHVEHGNTHWLRGFYISKLFTSADKVVQTCCLKTHRFGGHFTLSLKNSVGLVAKKLPGSIYDYMWELHSSPHKRSMIAEINKYFNADIVIMDGFKAFVDGGPESGKEVEPNLMLASNDRVAIDAVGVALLRQFGSTSRIMNNRIFEQDQLRRAAELEIGVTSSSEIHLTAINEEAKEAAENIIGILDREG